MIYTNKNILLATIRHVLRCDWLERNDEARLLSYDQIAQKCKTFEVKIQIFQRFEFYNV